MGGTKEPSAERIEHDAELEKKLDNLISGVEKDRNDLTVLVHDYVPHDHQKLATEAISRLADRARDFLIVQKPNVSGKVHHNAPSVAKGETDSAHTVLRDGTTLN